MPLAEVIYDFYDRFKSVTQGYGSFDYDLTDYRESSLRPSGYPRQRGKGRRPLPDRPSRPGTGAGVLACDRLKEEIPGRCSKSPFRGRSAEGDLALDDQPLPKGRNRQVLWRRYLPEKKTPGETEKREETHEDDRAGQHSPERLPGGSENGRRLIQVIVVATRHR